MNGKRKAAVLLMHLDPGTAAELVKGLSHEAVHDIAVEVAFLEASGFRPEMSGGTVVKEFCETLALRKDAKPKSFLGHMLTSAVGKEKAGEITSQIQGLVKQRDPFMAIRQTSTEKLVEVLRSEHPQVAANVLLELPLKKSMEIVEQLSEEVRTEAVRRMTNPEAIPWEARQKIAAMVEKKLRVLAEKEMSRQQAAPVSAEGSKQESPLRKVALLLRGLGKELRDGLVKSIQQKNSQLAAGVMEQMVLWEDIPVIVDRSLQEAVRGLDSKQLATALFKADGAIISKIRANISERAAAMIDEETSFMKDVPKEQIAKARNALVDAIRVLNAKGQISFQG
ncbi:MAG TPA: FliG C-terminal domain-containing protein [Sedimentisphaerales bacterium]|nr:FliG C-terminal domain-containing protein [Sedimentisphaerales bacterium]